ncbi:proline-rich receptor-like protein kinase PERK2 [Dendrobium catenatum]|uniref:proline-rich receptor-like protein kinase PERK2 n=1 Tax=Dendrobium catenatum TaxID=906689 RepID=UPI0010A055D4|nr:proline-rich receptor-like protein kinase PERK2 [Dendrobium catenatum]
MTLPGLADLGFFFGRPFILQQWNPKFIPKRDEFTSIPIWVKIVDLPLAVWNPPGISKIASFIGHPLAVDALTARKTRLTFARVCILVTSKSTFPDEIPISLDGDDVNLKVIYDWKPTPCSGCGSLVHPPNLCPKNPQPKTVIPFQPRARSKSRPRGRPPLPPSPSPAILSYPPSTTANLPPTAADPPPIVAPSHEEEKSKTNSPVSVPIPNLNLPSSVVPEDPSSSFTKTLPSPSITNDPGEEEFITVPSSPKNNRKTTPPPWIKPTGNLSTSPNKFDPLLLEDSTEQSGESEHSSSNIIPLSDEPPDPKQHSQKQPAKNPKTKSAKKAQKSTKSK